MGSFPLLPFLFGKGKRMSNEHKDITDPNIHPPKGFAAASNGQSPTKSDGLGELIWTYPGGGVFGQMDIIGNTTAIAVSAATDTTLNTDANYVKITGAGAPWVATHQRFVTFVTDKLQVQVPGIYFINFWCSGVISANNTRIAIKFAVNDTAPYSVPKLATRSTEVNDTRNLAASSIITSLAVNDSLSLYVAASGATNVTLQDAGFSVILLRHIPA